MTARRCRHAVEIVRGLLLVCGSGHRVQDGHERVQTRSSCSSSISIPGSTQTRSRAWSSTTKSRRDSRASAPTRISRPRPRLARSRHGRSRGQGRRGSADRNGRELTSARPLAGWISPRRLADRRVLRRWITLGRFFGRRVPFRRFFGRRILLRWPRRVLLRRLGRLHRRRGLGLPNGRGLPSRREHPRNKVSRDCHVRLARRAQTTPAVEVQGADAADAAVPLAFSVFVLKVTALLWSMVQRLLAQTTS